MSFVAFQTTIFIIMVAAFSSLLTHSYLINSYQSLIGHLFLFLIVIISLYKSRKFAWISIFTISILYSVLQLKIYSQNLQTDINISIQYFSLFLIVGILISEISHRMKYILPGLEHLDLVDKKTGVWNKDNITSLVRTNIERHKRYNRNFSVVLFELQNGIKLTGRLLKKIGLILNNSIRLTDEVGRIKQGSFVLILPETTAKSAAIVTDRICTKLKAVVEKEVDVIIYDYPENEDDLNALFEHINH